MFPEYKRLFQFILDSSYGDWLLFEDHTEIRIYGCELPPNQLPALLTPRFFILIIFAKDLIMLEVYFRKNKSIINFRIPQ